MRTVKGFMLFDEFELQAVSAGLIITDPTCEMILRSDKSFTNADDAHGWLTKKSAEVSDALKGFQLERKTEFQS